MAESLTAPLLGQADDGPEAEAVALAPPPQVAPDLATVESGTAAAPQAPGLTPAHNSGGKDATHDDDRAADAAIYLMEGSYNHKFVNHPSTPVARDAFLFTHSPLFDRVDFAACLLLLAIAVFERPAVWEVPFAVPLVLEGLALAVIFAARYYRARAFGRLSEYFENKGNIAKTLLLVGVLLEFLLAALLPPHTRVYRLVRPLFILDTNYGAGMRRVLRQIFVSFLQVVETMSLVLFFIMISAIFAFSLFKEDGDPNFDTYDSSFVSLFVLITTANYPDVMMAAFKRSYFSPIFFWVYLLVALFFLMNLLLAIVFTVFTDFLKNKFRRIFQHQRHALRFAFSICQDPDVSGITYPMFKAILLKYNPLKSPRDALLAFHHLDQNNNGYLTLDEFYQFYTVNRIQWSTHSEVASDSFHAKLPKSLQPFLKVLKWTANNPYFEHLMDTLILINTAIVLALVITEGAQRTFETTFQPIFTALYVVEAFIKILGLGPTAYFQRAWNIFDFTIVSSTVLGVIVQEAILKQSTGVFVSLFRSLRVLRLLRIRRTFQDILLAMSTLLPRLLVFLGSLFCVYYVFAVVGMATLDNTISRLTPENCDCTLASYLAPPLYYQLNNFDNLLFSYNTLFELMVVNNWHVIMELHVAATTRAARIFFFLYFLLVVIVVSNIIIAFILEAFQTVYPLIKEHHEALAAGREPSEDLLKRQTAKVPVEIARREIPGLIVPDGETVVSFSSGLRLTQEDVYFKLYEDDLKEWITEDQQRAQELFSGSGQSAYNDYIGVVRRKRRDHTAAQASSSTV